MRFYFFLTVLLFGLYSNVTAQQQDFLKGKLVYTEHPVLSWDDFKADPDVSSSFFALVNSGVSYSWNYFKDSASIHFTYKVHCIMDPEKSWVKKGKEGEELLEHEQLHFDISELHARILRKEFSEYNYLNSRNIRKDLKRIHTKINEDREEMQRVYDTETNHSKEVIQQALWSKKVKNLLEEYKEFAG